MNFRIQQFVKSIATFSIAMATILSSQSSLAQTFAEEDFKKLALEMVDDLERAFGPNYVDGPLKINLQDYRSLIRQTQLILTKEPIDNHFYETDDLGQTRLIREANLAAVNYFPNLKRIKYSEPIWSQLAKQKNFSKMKIMLHHEFVPFFLNAPDREGRYNKKLQEIYEKKDSWATLKTGFYRAVNFDDKMSEILSDFYWYYVHVSKNGKWILIEMIENPEGDRWCLDCYVTPPMMIPIQDMNNKVLPISSENLFLKTPLGDVDGVPYVRKISNDSFLLSSNLTNNLNNFAEEIKDLGSEAKGVIFERVRNIAVLNWMKPKNLTTFAYAFTNGRDCEAEKNRMIEDLAEACKQYLASPFTRPVAKNCHNQIIEVFDMSKIPIYSKYSCPLLGKGSLMTPEGFMPLGPNAYAEVLSRWLSYVKAAISEDFGDPRAKQ